MYCDRCGAEVSDAREHCDRCGHNKPHFAVRTREKNANMAAIFSFLFAGLGQMYVGRITLGIGLMFLFIVILAGALFALVFTLGVMGLAVFAMIILVMWMFNVFHAYNLAMEYNDSVVSTGQRPW
jgi:TM2 domain-containing membrane protein YozV